MNNKDITIIIPVYNEEKSLLHLKDKIKKLSVQYNILFVNDGSKDNSENILKEAGFNVVSNPYNIGYGGALKKGIRETETSKVAIMDADFQHRPEDLKEIIKHSDKFDMVIGQRGADSYFPPLRRPGKFLINKFASYVAGFKIKDINSGIRVFNRSDVMKFMNILPNSFSFTTTITLLYIKEGFSIKYIPVKVLKRKGKSSVDIIDGLKTLLLILRTLLLIGPLRFFLPLSLIFFVTGCLELYYEYYLNNFFHVSTSSILIFVSALLVFLFGLISEQINELKRIDKS
ncbi:MAG: glycosyltransferase family 2 protein [Candidatus Muiribacteriota bacterium]